MAGLASGPLSGPILGVLGLDAHGEIDSRKPGAAMMPFRFDNRKRLRRANVVCVVLTSELPYN